MLNKKIAENFDFVIYSGAFRDYIKENCLLSAECIEELQKIENFYFSYNFSIEDIKKLERLLKKDEYLILFSVNVFNNSLNVRIYGKIDMKKAKELRENIVSILSKEKYTLYTYNVLRLYDKRAVMAYELHFYSERCTPLLLQKIADRLKIEEDISKVVYDDPEPVEIIKAIKEDSVIVQLRTIVMNPTDDTIKLYINIYGPKLTINHIQNTVNQVLTDYLFIPEATRVTYVPGTTLQYQRNEIIYNNDLTKF
ncbi:MAG: hypothetical protein IKB36_03520 [Clostridia bacterium]|nr:hypothetical protein [Clostridia bacterium]